MISHLCSLGRTCLALPAVLIVLLLPTVVRAETIVVQNTTPAQVVVQASSVFQGKLERDRPWKLAPGEKVAIMLPGDKIITIYDAAMPNKVLNSFTVRGGNVDLWFVIVLKGNGQDVKFEVHPVPPPKRP